VIINVNCEYLKHHLYSAPFEFEAAVLAVSCSSCHGQKTMSMKMFSQVPFGLCSLTI
jgi:hypothetical protein